MKRAALALVVVYAVVLSSSTLAQSTKPVDTLPLEQVHGGMRGVAYTVFQGTKPEPMEVEVLGVLKNANGPKATSSSSGWVGRRRNTPALLPA